MKIESTVGEPSQTRVLGFKVLMPYLLLFLGLSIPVVGLTGWYQPGKWNDYSSQYGNSTDVFETYLLCTALLLIPVLWVLASRTLDLLALALAQSALIFSGYFYLDQTSQHIESSTEAIIQTAGLVVLMNLVGFICFFLALGTTYQFVSLGRFQLKQKSSIAALDSRMILFFRILSLGCAFSIALPMVLTRTVPLLSSHGSEARLDMIVESDVGRSVYHMGTALLPFVVATLCLAILRQPWRALGWDGVMVLTNVTLQLLTSNRLPLSITLMVTLCLFSMQYRVPRWLLVVALIGYVFIFTFLSGFTSLLRSDPAALQQPDWFNSSLQEAYLGDNIIDLRDGSWVFSQWDFDPLLGKTYLGGAFSMLPSGIFPLKKQWHLGLTGVRIVGMPDDEHFGLRITFFGEAFLNFGWAGVVVLGVVLGSLFAILLRQAHLSSQSKKRSLTQNIIILMLMQCLMPLSNTSDAFISWVILALLGLLQLFVIIPADKIVKKNA